MVGSVRGDPLPLPSTFWVGTHTVGIRLGAAPFSICFTRASLVFPLTSLGKLRHKGVCTGVAREKEGGAWLWILLWCQPHGQSGESR